MSEYLQGLLCVLTVAGLVTLSFVYIEKGLLRLVRIQRKPKRDQVTASRITSVNASAITGTITSSMIASVNARDITGLINPGDIVERSWISRKWLALERCYRIMKYA